MSKRQRTDLDDLITKIGELNDKMKRYKHLIKQELQRFEETENHLKAERDMFKIERDACRQQLAAERAKNLRCHEALKMAQAKIQYYKEMQSWSSPDSSTASS